jgi:hypothetical protein
MFQAPQAAFMSIASRAVSGKMRAYFFEGVAAAGCIKPVATAGSPDPDHDPENQVRCPTGSGWRRQ